MVTAWASLRATTHSVRLHVAVNRMSEAVVKMKIGPFGNHVVGPGFHVNITAFAGEGKFVTLQTTELTTGEYEQNNTVDEVIPKGEFSIFGGAVMTGYTRSGYTGNHGLATAHVVFILTPNDDEAGMHNIPDYGMIVDYGYEFDLDTWDESKYTLWANVFVHFPEHSEQDTKWLVKIVA